MTIKKDPKSYFLISSDSQTCSRGKILHHCILLFISFDLICNMTTFVQNEFWTLRGNTPWPCPLGSYENSKCVPPVLIHRAITCDSFKAVPKKPKRSWVTIKKQTNPKSYFLTSRDPQTCPGQNCCTTIFYSL